SARDSRGTSKKFEPRVETSALGAHNYIAAAFERAGVENFRRPDFIDTGRLVNMPRDADLRLHFFDKPARRRTADRFAAHDSIALGVVGRRVTDHQQRPHLADGFVA